MPYHVEREGDYRCRCAPVMEGEYLNTFWMGRSYDRTIPRHIRMNPFKEAPTINGNVEENAGFNPEPEKHPWACTVVHLGDVALCRARKE